MEQLLSLVSGERCGSGCGLFIRYLYFLLGTEENHNVPVRGANPWTELDQQLFGQTNPMEESSWETYSFSASQNISWISQNPKIHYNVRKSPLLVQILSQINPVRAVNPIALASILLFHSYLGLPSGPLTSAVPTKPLHAILVPPICAAACTTHLNLLRFSR